MHIAYAWGDLLNSMLDLNTTLKVHHGHQQGHFAFRNIAEGSSSSYAVYEDPSSCRERLVCNCSTRLAEHTLSIILGGYGCPPHADERVPASIACVINSLSIAVGSSELRPPTRNKFAGP